MTKTIKIIFSLIIIIFFSTIIVLSTTGIKTNKFNSFISQKIKQNNDKIEIELQSIYFKLDIKEVSLFLETESPKIYYKNNLVPSSKIRVYLDFLSIIKSEGKIKKVILNLNQFSVDQLKTISQTFKPSNFQSFIKNKLIKGKINSEVELYLDINNSLDNFIARGTVLDLNVEISKDLKFKETSFNFIADQTDLLLKNFSGKSELFSIEEGDLKADLSSEIKIETNFKTNINFNEKLKNLEKFFPYFNHLKNLSDIQAKLNNSLFLNFDKTYKLKDYDYKNNGKITNANFDLTKFNLDHLLKRNLKKLSIIDTDIKTNLNPKKNLLKLSGKYSLNDSKNLGFDISNIIEKDLVNLKFNADYDELFEVKIINYIKNKGDVAKINFDLVKNKNSIKVNQVNLSEGKNSLILKGAKFSNGKFKLFDELVVKTYEDNKKNNDFSIIFNKGIYIKGKKFDASNLPKLLKQQTGNNIFSEISSDIEIDLNSIIAPVSKKLKNFKLIGRIEKGLFVKITSKGDFGENNFLDITMQNDNNNKKYLEIYSDLTKPLLTEYNFFEGLTGGKLLFTSIIGEDSSSSKLKIENFKVIDAPGMVQLLSLADLGGLADLAEGEGISFDTLEINIEKNKNNLKINEILALGPSISVLMEGYQDQNVTSLRGTLVPAKTLNTIISKIPLIGDIIIPKEVGEGLFGISFKMKGPHGELKTIINPIRTITPRFIQKIIDKKKLPNNFN